MVVEFTVRRGPDSAAAGEVFRPHQAFVRAVHVDSGAAAVFRSKVALLPGTPPNPAWSLTGAGGICMAAPPRPPLNTQQEAPRAPLLSWAMP